MRRNFLKVLGLSLISSLLLPINFISAATKKLFNKDLTDEQKNIMFNEGTERPFSSELNKEKSNAILVCHAISGDSHVAKHEKEDIPGWWDVMVGPGKSIDTSKYFVICSNVIGGCNGSTGPNSLDPKTGKEFGSSNSS